DPYGRFSGYLNGSGGFSRGVELGVDVRPARALRVRAAYTYTNAETDEDLSVEGFFKVPSVSPHTASFVVSHAWRDALGSTVEILHVSSSYTPLSANGRPRAYRFPAYTTVNAVAAWRVPSAAASLRVYVRAENLLDETYYVGGWRALGRTAAIGLSIGY